MTPKFLRLVALLIEGTAVPRSLGVLGTAEKPWDELTSYLHLRGYSSAEEIEEKIKRKMSAET